MNDTLLFQVIGFALGVYVLTLIAQAALFVIRWLRHEKAVEAMIDRNEIPADYGVVRAEQEMLNQVDETGSFEERIAEDIEIRRGAVETVRIKTALIREAGFIIGEQDKWNDVAFDLGVRANPFKQGSGEAKQWVRGYCMARSVIDIKPYYDAA